MTRHVKALQRCARAAAAERSISRLVADDQHLTGHSQLVQSYGETDPTSRFLYNVVFVLSKQAASATRRAYQAVGDQLAVDAGIRWTPMIVWLSCLVSLDPYPKTNPRRRAACLSLEQLPGARGEACWPLV